MRVVKEERKYLYNSNGRAQEGEEQEEEPNTLAIKAMYPKLAIME